MELQKIVAKRSRTKELQTGVAKRIANLGCEKELEKKSWKKKLQKGVAKRSRKRR